MIFLQINDILVIVLIIVGQSSTCCVRGTRFSVTFRQNEIFSAFQPSFEPFLYSSVCHCGHINVHVGQNETKALRFAARIISFQLFPIEKYQVDREKATLAKHWDQTKTMERRYISENLILIKFSGHPSWKGWRYIGEKVHQSKTVTLHLQTDYSLSPSFRQRAIQYEYARKA